MATNLEDEIARRACLAWTDDPRTWEAALAPTRERWLLVARAVLAVVDEAADARAKPIPMLLWCPGCGERHIDRGTFATKPHHTHACQSCGMVWRPAKADTAGVEFLPGYKDAPHEEDVSAQTRTVTRCRAWSYPGHASWDCELHGKPDGRQCALDANHHDSHELVGPWTRRGRVDAYPGGKP